jgi:hypothetical protein
VGLTGRGEAARLPQVTGAEACLAPAAGMRMSCRAVAQQSVGRCGAVGMVVVIDSSLLVVVLMCVARGVLASGTLSPDQGGMCCFWQPVALVVMP